MNKTCKHTHMSKLSHLSFSAAPCWNFRKCALPKVPSQEAQLFPHHSVTAWKGVTSGANWTLQKKRSTSDYFLHSWLERWKVVVVWSHVTTTHVENEDSFKFKSFSGVKLFCFVLSGILMGTFFVEMNAFLQPSSIKQVQCSRLD